MTVYTLAAAGCPAPCVELPTTEPGWRELWPGELIPQGAEEWHETIRRWLPIDGGGVYRPTLDHRLKGHIVRVRT